ncbi:MAG: DUF937 domain-containing protein [Actinomycetales bacterium]|nr:DUF937 domain-containing protein [Actinomycetales bacterium]
MSEIDQLLAQIPIEQLAEQLGVDEAQAQEATRAALPALLGGLQANVADPAGALSLGQALQQHDGSLFGDDVADLGGIDTADGQKIVANIFGDNTDQVIQQLGGVSGRGGSSLISKLLPILAPIVLAYLSKKLQQSGGLGDILGQVLGGGASPSTSTRSGGGSYQQEQPSGPLIPTDGSSPADQGYPQDQGGSGGSASDPMGGILGDILGQVLGGAASQAGGSSRSSAPNAGSIITDVLGGLLGGGRR